MGETNQDLFAAVEPPKPALREREDFYSLFARKALGITDPRWRWYSLEAIGDDGAVAGGRSHTLLKGGIPGILKSGPRKGGDNWKTRDRSYDRTLVISDAEFRAFVRAWEIETGRCEWCNGAGLTSDGWSKETGAHALKACHRCKGTGKPAEATNA